MSRTFKYTKLAAALAVAFGASTPVSAVNLSDDNLGDVGLVSYYTVRNGIDTYLSMVNTSPDYVVAVKLRFREGDNTRDARDFNIFLSPNDVWTAAVTMSEDGETPVVQTVDESCTAPALSEAAATFPGARGVQFTSLAYDGSGGDAYPYDTGIRTIERTQEGHIEIIEMGVADPDVSQLAEWAVHGAGQNCQAIINTYAGTQSPNRTTDGRCNIDGAAVPVPFTGLEAFEYEYCEPLNVLKFAANMQAITAGASTGLPVTTLANFFNPQFVEDQENPDPEDLMREPQQQAPDLRNATPFVALQTTNDGNIQDDFLNGRDVVSSLMMATSVMNEYAIGGAALAATDWVVTFPTKNLYVDRDLSTDLGPFQYFFQGDTDGNGASCVSVVYGYYDREENFEREAGIVDFSPRPPGALPSSICQETQTLGFDPDRSLLGSRNNYGVVRDAAFENGWMRLLFTEAGTISGASYTYAGLPVLGFSIKGLRNALVEEGVLRNYAIVSEHAYAREITPNN